MRFKKLSKSAQIGWVEITFIILIVAGFILAALIDSPIITYAVAFICGLIFGKLIYHKKEDTMFPYIMLAIGFIIGYLIGTRTGSHLAVAAAFVLGNVLCYKIHEQGWI